MKARTKADILFDYIVSGDSMEKIANNNDINTGEVSALLRAYGFNYKFQGKYQSGQHRGYYKNGYTINYTYNNKKYSYTHKIKLNDILEFVKEYEWASKDNPCDNDEFESFLDEYLEDVAEEAVNQKIKEQEKCEREAKAAERERQRRAEEARQRAEQERHRQAEEARQRAEEAERERRRQAEEARQRAEEAERKAREELLRETNEKLHKAEELLHQIEEKRKNEQFNSLYNEGVKLFEAKKLNDALAKFREAEKIKTTDELNAQIAYTLASASNSDDFAEEINKRICKVLTLTKDNQSSKDKYIYAKSELALGRKGLACCGFFEAGHIAYEKGDYALADKYYTEGLDGCGYYDRSHNSTKKTPFRMAYARGQKDNLTTDDHNYIIEWYKEAIKESVEVGLSYGNMAYEYLQLQQYEEARDAAKNALKNGNEQQYVFKHLINACWELKDYNGVIAACNKAKAAGCKINYFKLGYSLSETGDDDSAISAYKECIRLDDDTASRWNLAMIFYKKEQYSEAVKYAEIAIQKFSQVYRDKHGKTAVHIAVLANDEAARDRMLQYLPKERERLEQERLEQERVEQERLEQERLEQERLEQERLEQERLEQERLEQEHLEQERLEQERLEQERLEQERLEQERLEQEKQIAIKRRRDDEIMLLLF